MNILCAISGIEFKCDYFPAELSSREVTHPIFYLQQKKLISYLSKWTAGELTPTDSYLLFLALLNSTELVEWRVPVIKTDATNSIIATNMEQLFKVIGQLNLIKTPQFAVPQFAVTKETRDLDNVHYWIKAWQDAIDEFYNEYKTTGDWNAIRTRELALERMIKTSTRDVSSYSGVLADWAELAGNFPQFDITDYKGARVSLADYWKLIIRKCCKSESIFEIPKADLDELIEHCEANIMAGSIYSHSLFTLLREGREKQSSFLGTDLTKTEFVILDENNSIEEANMLLLINSATDTEPKPSDYPNRLMYLKAKLKYDMASKYKEGLAKLETNAGVI